MLNSVATISPILISCNRSFHNNNNNNNRNRNYENQSSNNQQQTSFFSNRRTSTPFVVKDREPFPGTELRDGKTKFAVLIDGEKVSPENYQKNVEQQILTVSSSNEQMKKNAICLRRYFRYEKSQEWASRFSVDNNNETGGVEESGEISETTIRKTPNTSSINALLGPPQYFRVDSFIPINMQIAADAAHLVEFRNENLISGIVFVVCAEEVEAYQTLVENNFKNIPGMKMMVIGGGK